MGIPSCGAREIPVLPAANCALIRRQFLFPLLTPYFLSLRLLPKSISHIRAGRIQSLRCHQWRKRRQVANSVAAREFSLDEDFVVVSFYHLLPIQNPQSEISNHLSFIQGRDIRGRIYINEQGINAQYSGPREDATAYAEWLREDERFSDLLVQISPSPAGHAFPRLRLRYKPSLVQLEGGSSHLPLVDPAKRATPLTPSEWKQRLQDKNCLLLDVRNGYEWDIGHFRGAQRPDVDCFRSTTFGQSESADSDPLTGVDKEKTDILMYCTGGIRCDVYSTILRERGFENLYTLSGGVSNYLSNESAEEWEGNLFVFDARLSLPPEAYNQEREKGGGEKTSVDFASCHICQSPVDELRHRNCANLDCNLLFLCCSGCVEKMGGCCSSECTTGPRLRPPLIGEQRYRFHKMNADMPRCFISLSSVLSHSGFHEGLVGALPWSADTRF